MLGTRFSIRKERLSAAICALKAYDANPKAIPEDFVRKMMEDIGTEEVGTPLNFAVSGKVIEPRSEPVKVRPLAVEGVDKEIVDLQVDPVPDRVFAFARAQPAFYVLEGKAPGQARKVTLDGTIVAGCANAGHLYVILEAPPALARVDPATGTIEKRWPLKVPPSTVAVYPRQSLAFFPLGGTLQKLNLRTSEVTPLPQLATRVRVDPRQRFCFSDIYPEQSNDSGGLMIVNGRPIFFERSDTDWRQTSLVRYAIAGEELLASSSASMPPRMVRRWPCRPMANGSRRSAAAVGARPPGQRRPAMASRSSGRRTSEVCRDSSRPTRTRRAQPSTRWPV